MNDLNFVVFHSFLTELGTPSHRASFELIQFSTTNHPPKLTPRTGTSPARIAD